MDRGELEGERPDVLATTENKIQPVERDDSQPCTLNETSPLYPDDYRFSRLLMHGNREAWQKFDPELRTKVHAFLDIKYPNTFGDVAADEIIDAVKGRLEHNSLREYRGNCSLSSWVTKATEWAVLDWLRKHADGLTTVSTETVEIADDFSIHDSDYLSTGEFSLVPEPIRDLGDDQRWSFLLRYYDFFGFPSNEIVLLAEKRKISCETVGEKILRYFEYQTDDVLGKKRAKRKKFHEKIEQIGYQIHRLNLREHELESECDKMPAGSAEEDKKQRIELVRRERFRHEKRLRQLMNQSRAVVVTTPYKIIADIVGEKNENTVRGWVMEARKRLKASLLRQG
jgi:hypothetical protein